MQNRLLNLSLIFCLSFLASAPLMSAPESGQNVTLKQNFQNVDIKVVIEAVAKLTGKNFIIDPRVKGNVTLIAPDPMPPESLYQTLLNILRVHGYVAVPGETATSIIPANLARDQIPYAQKKFDESNSWITQVLPVKNVPAAKLVAVLRPLVAREGHLVALQESNSLIVTDSRKNISRIKNILKRVDVDTDGGYDVIKVNYASAEDIVRTVKSIVPKATAGKTLKLNYDERSNRVIITGDPQQRLELRALIAELDVPIVSSGRVQVVYLRYAKAKDLVPVLQKISTNQSLLNSVDVAAVSPVQPKGKASVTSSSINMLDKKTLQERISIEADERMNAVVISAPPSIITALKGVIKQLDIRRAQVLIEAILVEVSETKLAELGVEWGVNGPNGVGLIDFSGTIPTIIGSAAAGDPTGAASALGRGASFAAGQINAEDGTGWAALIRALNADTGSNILATPTLLTLDNEEAQIVVGREVPFQTGTYTSTGASSTPNNPFNTIERKNVGLTLKIKPQINEGDEVFLDIDQEVSNVLPSGEAVDIQTSKRQIKTKVIVGDGKMIVLGGLLDERETEVVRKVPGLGDIPLLGALFTSRENQREKVNLMVFLRPVIVRESTMTDYYSKKKYSLMRKEQARVLENDLGLMNRTDLRPVLPTAEQWENSGPASPYKPKPEPEEKQVDEGEEPEDNLLDI